MKLLLTSGGITNNSIRQALLELLGKPIAASRALCIPTAQWGHPMCGPASVRGFIAAGPDFRYLSGLGWASLGVLELTALPTIGAERWVPWVQAADVLLVDGGDATYLCHWMRESGLASWLPSLTDLVWVGVSAGSMVMTPALVPTSSSGRPRRTTAPWESWTSRSSHTWTLSPRTLSRMQSDGLPTSASRPMPSTNRPPSSGWMAPSKSSPKVDGNYLHPNPEYLSGAKSSVR